MVSHPVACAERRFLSRHNGIIYHNSQGSYKSHQGNDIQGHSQVGQNQKRSGKCDGNAPGHPESQTRPEKKRQDDDDQQEAQYGAYPARWTGALLCARCHHPKNSGESPRAIVAVCSRYIPLPGGPISMTFCVPALNTSMAMARSPLNWAMMGVSSKPSMTVAISPNLNLLPSARVKTVMEE